MIMRLQSVGNYNEEKTGETTTSRPTTMETRNRSPERKLEADTE